MSTTNDIPYGYCQCGCGLLTRISPRTTHAFGWIKGEPRAFIHGHNRRKPVRYVEQDRGYDTPCWIWQLSKTRDGHGQVSTGRTHHQAHRFYYERVHGPLPRAILLHHRCEQPACVNPEHLQPVSTAEHEQIHSNLNWNDVRDIRSRVAAGENQRPIAADYGISRPYVSMIASHKTWREVA